MHKRILTAALAAILPLLAYAQEVMDPKAIGLKDVTESIDNLVKTADVLDKTDDLIRIGNQVFGKMEDLVKIGKPSVDLLTAGKVESLTSSVNSLYNRLYAGEGKYSSYLKCAEDVAAFSGSLSRYAYSTYNGTKNLVEAYKRVGEKSGNVSAYADLASATIHQYQSTVRGLSRHYNRLIKIITDDNFTIKEKKDMMADLMAMMEAEAMALADSLLRESEVLEVSEAMYDFGDFVGINPESDLQEEYVKTRKARFGDTIQGAALRSLVYFLLGLVFIATLVNMLIHVVVRRETFDASFFRMLLIFVVDLVVLIVFSARIW